LQTSHISLIILHHTQPIRSANSRLYFTAGDQVINLATSSIRCQKLIARVLTSGSSPEELLEKVKKVTENVVELTRREKRVLMDITKFEGDRVKHILQTGGNALVYRVDGGLDFINWVIFEVKGHHNSGAVVLASGEGKKGGQILIVGEEKSVKQMVKKVNKIFTGIKGGGKGKSSNGERGIWKR
jgi:misacylated tRNA(Ala) deacylase